MKNPHLTQPLMVWGQPVAMARAAVIALHGRSHSPGDIRSVCNRIGLEDFAYLAPTAADSSWYPLVFTAPLADNEPGLSQALERVDTLVNKLLAAALEPHRIALLGFSQGACILAEYALRHPRRYGALLVFTGSAIGPPGTEWPYRGDFAGTPVLVSGSTEDPWIPVERMRETALLLRNRGAVVTEHYYGGNDHIVSDDEIGMARQLLAAM